MLVPVRSVRLLFFLLLVACLLLARCLLVARLLSPRVTHVDQWNAKSDKGSLARVQQIKARRGRRITRQYHT
jgi:hypothetical protein